jgi:hypothetical protein
MPIWNVDISVAGTSTGGTKEGGPTGPDNATLAAMQNEWKSRAQDHSEERQRDRRRPGTRLNCPIRAARKRVL